MDQDIDDSSAQDEDITSFDVEMGDLSFNQIENPTHDQALENPPTPTKEEGEEKLLKNKSIFESWVRTLVMVPFTITITVFASLYAFNGNGFFKLSSLALHSFFFIVMLNFYISVIGIIIGRRFPSVARGFYLVAFLCVLLSLTILFAAILPNAMNLNLVPWIFLAIVAGLVISLVLCENY